MYVARFAVYETKNVISNKSESNSLAQIIANTHAVMTYVLFGLANIYYIHLKQIKPKKHIYGYAWLILVLGHRWNIMVMSPK